MNREQRRRAKKERREPYRPGLALLRVGLRLFWRTIRRNLDIVKLARTFDRDSLRKHNKRIAGHQDLSDGDITNEVVAMLGSKPGDRFYPVINSKNKAWKEWLEFKQERGYYRNLFSVIRILAGAGYQRLYEMANYLFSNDITRRYSLNKGRLPQVVDATVDAGLIHKGFTYSDDEGNTIMDVKDNEAESFVGDIELQMLCQKAFEIATDQKDKAMLEIYFACFDNRSTIEREHRRKLRKYQALGLRTPASVRQRMNRISDKYPQLKQLNPYR